MPCILPPESNKAKLHLQKAVISALVLVSFYLFLVDPCLKTVSQDFVEVSSVVDLACEL